MLDSDPFDLRHPRADATSTTSTVVPEMLAFLRRHRFLLGVGVLLGVAAAAIYYLTAEPSFGANTTILIDARRNSVVQQQSILGDAMTDSAMIESQVAVLQSENVARTVIRSQKLTEDPEFVGGSGSFLLNLVSKAFEAFRPEQPQSQERLVTRALEHLKRSLSVKRQGVSYVIEIGFSSRDPVKAANLANAVADAYVTDLLEAKFQAATRTSGWLQDRLKELREKATAADLAVEAFKASKNIVDTGRGLLNQQQLAELNSQLILAQAASAEAKARYDSIERLLKAKIADDALPDPAVTESLRNTVIQQLRSQYLELAQRNAELVAAYGPDQGGAATLRDRMRQISRSVFAEMQRIAEAYRNDYSVAKTRESAIEKGLEAMVQESEKTNQNRVALRDLESVSNSYRTLYDTFLQRYMQSMEQQSFPVTDARVITAATPPLRKSAPKGIVVLPAGLLLGLAGAMVLAFLREHMDRSFRSSRQVQETLGVTCLGLLPKLSNRAIKRDKWPLRAVEANKLPEDIGAMRHVAREPFSRFTEVLRSIKVSVDIAKLTSDRSGTENVLGVISALSGEGKTTVASNLAQLLAQTGNRTLLIDTDLRNPTLTRTIAPHAKSGLLEVLAKNAKIEEVLLTDPVTGMQFLPTPLPQRIANTADIVASPEFAEMLARLRSQYAYVVLDLPPLALVPDVRAASHLLNGFVLVMEWGRTPRELVSKTITLDPAIRRRVIGGLLNKSKGSGETGYGSYGSAYHGGYGYGEHANAA